MASRIQGITIEINANTTNLEQSLSRVSTRARDIQKELRDVERGLRLDPSNVELVAQRQQLLTEAVSASTERLEQLRSAQQQVQQQFESGTINDEQYRAFNREIVSAENNLRGLQNSLQQIGPETERLQTAQRALNNYLGATNQTVDDLSSTLGTRLTNAIRNGSASADQLETAVRRIGQASGRTGDELNRFQQALRDADGSDLRQIERDLQRVERQAEQTTNEIAEGFRNAGRIASGALSGIGFAAAGATAGLVAFVESQTELSTDLARLRTNAADAGFSLESVEDGFRRIAAVSGEADSAVEALSNLVATDFDENQLAQAIELVNGAAIRFSDTLKTEGIADGLQETFASGAAIGPFAELLERSGINVDQFNEGLAQASKNGTETNFVLEQLSNLGLKEVYDSYLETNSAITDYNQAVVDSQVRLADLSEAFRPFVTGLLDIGNTLLDVALGNLSFSEALTSVGEQVQNLGGRLLEASRNALPKFLDGFSEAFPRILVAGREILLKVVEGITSQIPQFIETAVNLATSLVGTLTDNFPQFLETGVRILNNIVNGIIQSLPSIARGAGSIILTLIQGIISNFPNIIQAGVNIIVNLISGLASSLPQVGSYVVGTLIPTITNIFRNTDFADLGRQIINGIVRGITSTASNAVNAVRGVVGNIINSAKERLGIRSPSRVFMGIGSDTIEGLSIGLESQKNNANNSLLSVVDTIQESARNGLDSVKSMLGENFNFNLNSSLNTNLNSNGIIPNNFLVNGGLTSSNQFLQQNASINSDNFSNIIEAINGISSNQSPVIVNLDGKVIAEVVSSNQAYNANALSLTRGVNL